MKKMPIKWHKECLKNSEENLKRERKHHNEIAERLRDHELRNAIYREQIRRAEEEGRDGFDADKFNKKRF